MRKSVNQFVRTTLSLALVLAVAVATGAEWNWPNWRGPHGDGHTREQGLPHRWDDDAIAWKTPLAGRGNSSPTIWGERIYLTSASNEGAERRIICLDRKGGRILWEHVAWTGEPEPSHVMNGWASATCATDGRHVYAFFGRGGLHCYTLDGEPVWSRNLGAFVGPWGTAASPLLVGNCVIQNCDSDEDAYVIALDKATGETIWKTGRPNYRGWSSPILVSADGRDEVVVNGHTGVSAYAPDTGRLLWTCTCDAGRGSPTVVPADGLLYVVNGLSGGGAYCVRPGGDGDVTDTRRVWYARRRGRDLPSPIVVGDTVLVMGLRNAILTAYDKRDGKEMWQERIGGQISASPIAYDELAFFIAESGRTIVVDPQAADKIVAANTLTAANDENFRSAITPSDGQLFVRSDRHLYCVGTRTRRIE